MQMQPIKGMLGITFDTVTNKDNKELLFENASGTFRFWHGQNCCERVEIEQIDGDLSDLVGSPIVLAEVAESPIPRGADLERAFDSATWTFYKFASAKGYVTVRWLGESNGYYSESVDYGWIPNSKET